MQETGLIIVVYVCFVRAIEINQHECVVIEKTTLKCSYSGEGNYEVDRVIGRIHTLEFNRFDSGTITTRGRLSDLSIITIKQTDQPRADLCLRIFTEPGVAIYISGKKCETPQDAAPSSTDSFLTSLNPSASSPTSSASASGTTTTNFVINVNSTDEEKVYKIIMIVLAVCLSMFCSAVIGRELRRRYCRTHEQRIDIEVLGMDEVTHFRSAKND